MLGIEAEMERTEQTNSAFDHHVEKINAVFDQKSGMIVGVQ